MTMKKIGFDVTVVPVVCFASDTFAAGIAQCGPVKVLNANAINEWFATQPCVLSPNELSRLVQLIETRK